MNDTSATGDEGIVSIVRFFLRNFLLIFGLSLALGIALFVGSAFMTPIYRAEVLVVAAEEPGAGALPSMLSNFAGLGRLAGLRGAGSTRKDEALAMLRSRSFVSNFIETNRGLSVLYPDAWDTKADTWKTTDVYVPSEQERYLFFTESVLGISENKDSGIIEISISLPDRLVAASWANHIVDLLNDTFRNYVSAEAQRSVEYLYNELDKSSSVELRQAIYRLIENQIQMIMLANVRKDFVFRVIDPAVAPDADYYVSPRRVLLAFLGLVVGGLLGTGIAVVRETVRAARRHEAGTE